MASLKPDEAAPTAESQLPAAADEGPDLTDDRVCHQTSCCANIASLVPYSLTESTIARTLAQVWRMDRNCPDT